MSAGGVWIIIPAHRRQHISRLAFAGIRWCLDELAALQIAATALVVADDENLELASSFDIETLRRPNQPLGRKWNDGYQYACEHGATHVMSCGSDDWIHPNLIAAMLDQQDGDGIAATRRSSIVSPDRSEVALLEIPYAGGDGIRMLPVSLLARIGYRPTLDKRNSAIDGAMQDRLSQNAPIDWQYVDSHPLQIVDFKSDENITPYDKFEKSGYITERVPFDTLLDLWPAALVQQAAGSVLVR